MTKANALNSLLVLVYTLLWIIFLNPAGIGHIELHPAFYLDRSVADAVIYCSGRIKAWALGLSFMCRDAGEAVLCFHTVLTSSVSLPGDYLYPTSHVSVVSLLHQHSLSAVKIGQAFDCSCLASDSSTVLLIQKGPHRSCCV